MTQEELEILLFEWQGRLRLRDWKIALAVTPPHEIEECEGRISVWNAEKAAVIRVSEHVGGKGMEIIRHHFPGDMEEVLVHEMLHILFDPFNEVTQKQKPLHDALEQAINLLAEALVTLRRGNGHEMEAIINGMAGVTPACGMSMEDFIDEHP